MRLVFGVWCLVFGVWCLVFGVWYQTIQLLQHHPQHIIVRGHKKCLLVGRKRTV